MIYFAKLSECMLNAHQLLTEMRIFFLTALEPLINA